MHGAVIYAPGDVGSRIATTLDRRADRRDHPRVRRLRLWFGPVAYRGIDQVHRADADGP